MRSLKRVVKISKRELEELLMNNNALNKNVYFDEYEYLNCEPGDSENEENGEEIKTFNTIANKDEILQMYLKDIGKIKLLNRTNETMRGKDSKKETYPGKFKACCINCKKIHRAGNFVYGFGSGGVFGFD